MGYALGEDGVNPMLHVAISHLAEQLNQFFKHTFELSEDVAVVSNLLELDGSMAGAVNNKLVMFVVNLEKDTMPYQQPLGSVETVAGREQLGDRRRTLAPGQQSRGRVCADLPKATACAPASGRFKARLRHGIQTDFLLGT